MIKSSFWTTPKSFRAIFATGVINCRFPSFRPLLTTLSYFFYLAISRSISDSLIQAEGESKHSREATYHSKVHTSIGYEEVWHRMAKKSDGSIENLTL